MKKYSVLPTVGSKVKNAEKPRQIDARSEAEGIKAVISIIINY